MSRLTNPATVSYRLLETKIGTLLITATPAGLTGLRRLHGQFSPPAGWRVDPAKLAEAAEQITAYLSGDLRIFDLRLDLQGTPFQLRVWRALEEIPYGTTVSYSEIAREIGSPRAVRAVGSANGANPLLLIVPCHRVIAQDGSLAGYREGIELKRWLLDLERQTVKRGERTGAGAGGLALAGRALA